MEIELTKDQLAKQNEFRVFATAEIAPYAAKNDIEEKTPPELIRKLADSGYLGSMIPKEYGGLGMDMITIGLLNEEIGRVCSSIRSLLTVHGMVALAILRWGTKEQREYWLPKMASVSVSSLKNKVSSF